MRTPFQHISLAVGFVVGHSGVAAAQGYLPVNERASTGVVGLVANASAVCDPVPTLSGSFKFWDHLMTHSAAAKAGILGVSGSGDGTSMVAVRDYAKAEQCTATDGRTRLLYGEAVRTAIVIRNYNASLGANFAVIAANATINKTTYDVSVETIGWNNPEAIKLIAELAGKTLNVETYAAYKQIETQLISLTVAPATTHTVMKLGIVSVLSEDNDLVERLAASFALQKIADGLNCLDAQSHVKLHPGEIAKKAIADTYMFLAGGRCDKSSLGRPERNRATALLNGLKVKY